MADDFDRVKLNPISTNQLSSLIIGEKGLPKNIGQAGDPELEYLTEGNVPISEADMKTRQIRKKFGDQRDEILGGFWDSIKGGAQSAWDFYNFGPKGPPEDVVIERAQKAQQDLENIRLKESTELLNEDNIKDLGN